MKTEKFFKATSGLWAVAATCFTVGAPVVGIVVVGVAVLVGIAAVAG